MTEKNQPDMTTSPASCKQFVASPERESRSPHQTLIKPTAHNLTKMRTVSDASGTESKKNDVDAPDDY